MKHPLFLIAIFLLSIGFACAQQLIIRTPTEGQNIPFTPGAPNSVVVEWGWQNVPLGTKASISMDGLPAVTRDQIEPIVFFAGNGEHTLTGQLLDTAGNQIPGTQVLRKFSVGTQVDHCANKLLDQSLGETGVDCGGSCAPCVGQVPPLDYVPPAPEPPIKAFGLPAERSISTSSIIGIIAMVLGLTVIVALVARMRGPSKSGPGGVDPAVYNDVVKYVQQYGIYYTPEQLGSELLKSGYSQETINSAFADAQRMNAPPLAPRL